MSTNNTSWRHHYLPVFYLNGFTDDDGRFYVYDIQKKKIKSKKLYPKQVFFEKERNTLEFSNGAKTDFLETEIYKRIDNIYSKVISEILNTNYQSNITEHQRIYLFGFVNQLFWRIPRTDKEIKKIFDNVEYKDLKIKVVNKVTKEINTELTQELIKSNFFRQTYRSILSGLEIHDWNMIEHPLNWVISYGNMSKSSNSICGDNPIVLKNNNVLNLTKNYVIFPLSKYHTMFSFRDKIKLKELPPEYAVMIDLIIFKQSKLMVVGCNKGYLEELSRLSELYTIEQMKYNLFKFLS